MPDVYGPITAVPFKKGGLVVINGKHRLASLMALGVPRVAIQICLPTEIRAMMEMVQDRAWPSFFYRKSRSVVSDFGPADSGPMEKAKPILDYIRSNRLETWADIYHPLPFAEFTGLTTQVSPSTPYQRLAAILKCSGPVAGKHILDIGANVGFYTFSLAQRQARVTALERRPEYAHIAAMVGTLYSLDVNYLTEPVAPHLIERHGPFDIALCFSVLQWIISQHGDEFGRSILQALSRRSAELYFDVAVNQGKAALQCPSGQEKAFVYHLLRSCTDYRHVECVGRTRPYGAGYRYLFHCRHSNNHRPRQIAEQSGA